MSTLSLRRSRRNLRRHVFGEGVTPPSRLELDNAYASGFGLGLDDVPATAPREWHPDLRESFGEGYARGEGLRREDESDVYRAEVGRYERYEELERLGYRVDDYDFTESSYGFM